MPAWQIALLSGLFAIGIILTVARTDGSYVHAFVTGKCFTKPLPHVCHRYGLRG